jgi:hypothetical protein
MTTNGGLVPSYINGDIGNNNSSSHQPHDDMTHCYAMLLPPTGSDYTFVATVDNKHLMEQLGAPPDTANHQIIPIDSGTVTNDRQTFISEPLIGLSDHETRLQVLNNDRVIPSESGNVDTRGRTVSDGSRTDSDRDSGYIRHEDILHDLELHGITA